MSSLLLPVKAIYFDERGYVTCIEFHEGTKHTPEEVAAFVSKFMDARFQSSTHDNGKTDTILRALNQG